MNVLVLMANYLPGYKAGGPIRSVANLVAALGDEINFRIVARDRDLGCSERYATISDARWQTVGKASVAYVAPTHWPTLRLEKLADEARADVIYINSFFNRRCCAGTLALMQCGRIAKRPIVLAPHGEFSPGALAIRAWKKRPYLAALKAAGVAHRVLWHATSEPERDDIHRVMGRDARVHLAKNLCDSEPHTSATRTPKRAGTARFTFLSRIVPNKNLLGALDAVAGCNGRVELDIWGPIEHAGYWDKCQERIAALPSKVTACYRGVATPGEVREILADSDGFLLPTHTENFGYAIVEALVAGCPVVISDRTPWRQLSHRGAGWDLPLADVEGYRRAVQQLVDMDESAHSAMRRRAAEYGRIIAMDSASIEDNRQLFQKALDLNSTAPAALRRAA